MNVGWRERNQQDSTNLIFIVKLLSQHVSGIIMPIIRRTRPCIYYCMWCSALVVLAVVVCSWVVSCVHCVKLNSNLHTVHTAYDSDPHNHSHHNQCRTPYAVVHSSVLLMMGIMMPKTCWDRSLTINIRLVESCWFLSLHPIMSIVKPTICTNVSNLFYFGMTLYMFRTVFPSIISSSRLYIQQPNRYCCLLASGYQLASRQPYLFYSCM